MKRQQLSDILLIQSLMLMKATKFCKQKCYFLTFFCLADDLAGRPGGTVIN